MAENKYKNGKKRVFKKKEALGTDFDYREFIDGMPEEIRGELEQAVTMLLKYVHQPDVSDSIVEAVIQQDDVGTAIAQITLQAMDTIDPEHKFSDATKSVAGYFFVKEIIGLLHAADVARLGDEDVDAIYKNAVQNYIYQSVASQPDQGSKDKEAMRIQQEIEPLMQAQQEQGQQQEPQQQGPQGQPGPQQQQRPNGGLSQ